MNTKNYICILVGAALLVSCAAIHREPGKRTETGTVIKLTTSQITLRSASGTTWAINRTVDTEITCGTLKVGFIVCVDFIPTDGHML
jgi:hypothetical protein